MEWERWKASGYNVGSSVREGITLASGSGGEAVSMFWMLPRRIIRSKTCYRA